MIPSRSDIWGESRRAFRFSDALACDRRGLIRTAGEAWQSGQGAAQGGRVRRAVLSVHYHVDDRVYACACVQEKVTRDVEHCRNKKRLYVISKLYRPPYWGTAELIIVNNFSILYPKCKNGGPFLPFGYHFPFVWLYLMNRLFRGWCNSVAAITKILQTE